MTALDEDVVPRQSSGIVALSHEDIPAVADVGDLILALQRILRCVIVGNVQAVIIALKEDRGVDVALAISKPRKNTKAPARRDVLVVDHAPMYLAMLTVYHVAFRTHLRPPRGLGTTHPRCRPR